MSQFFPCGKGWFIKKKSMEVHPEYGDSNTTLNPNSSLSQMCNSFHSKSKPLFTRLSDISLSRHQRVFPSDRGESSRGSGENNNSSPPIMNNTKINTRKNTSSKIKNGYIPGMFDVWAIIITTVLVGVYYGWNVALVAGFGSYLIGQVLIGFAYISLAFSLGEIISSTSFSGGAYGMARVVMGFYMGFLVASFELMEYITYVSFSATYLASFVCMKYNLTNVYIPLICFLFHVMLTMVLLEQKYFFWRFNALLAIGSLGILLIYCVGSLSYTDFSKNAPLAYAPTDDDQYGYQKALTTSNNNTTLFASFSTQNPKAWFQGGIIAFLQTLPYATWGFAGVESAALITDMIENPRVNLSYGMALAVLTLFSVTIFTVMVAVSLPPGTNKLIESEYFMNFGWSEFGVDNNTAEWLVVPAQIAMGFGFAIPSFKLTHSMACSQLLPSWCNLATTTKKNNENDNDGDHHQSAVKINYRNAILFAMTFSYLICLLAYAFPSINLTNIATMFACFTYLSDLYAYYQMKTKFANRDHKFTNPFGLFGTFFATFMFLFTLIALLFLQSNYDTLYACITCLGFLTIYYFGYAKQYQQFSEDEQKSLMVLHVMQKAKRKKKTVQLKIYWMWEWECSVKAYWQLMKWYEQIGKRLLFDCCCRRRRRKEAIYQIYATSLPAADIVSSDSHSNNHNNNNIINTNNNILNNNSVNNDDNYEDEDDNNNDNNSVTTVPSAEAVVISTNHHHSSSSLSSSLLPLSLSPLPVESLVLQLHSDQEQQQQYRYHSEDVRVTQPRQWTDE